MFGPNGHIIEVTRHVDGYRSIATRSKDEEGTKNKGVKEKGLGKERVYSLNEKHFTNHGSYNFDCHKGFILFRFLMAAVPEPEHHQRGGEVEWEIGARTLRYFLHSIGVYPMVAKEPRDGVG